ncbi:hypothetical protein BS78_05G209400 [Paspalum vaginatum]|nr:hypothetical protein BS78_05G209400 [Paspalum vaginatum]
MQELDSPDARIADYFHVIAGTSTGAPRCWRRPTRTNGRSSPPRTSASSSSRTAPRSSHRESLAFLKPVANTVSMVAARARYDGAYLRGKIKSLTYGDSSWCRHSTCGRCSR